jgi:hypothetical protein
MRNPIRLGNRIINILKTLELYSTRWAAVDSTKPTHNWIPARSSLDDNNKSIVLPAFGTSL